MVRTAADRAFLPAKNLFEQVGDMMILTGKTIVSAIRPPYPYGGEFMSQFLFALRLCWFPLLISTVAFGYGAPGLQAANFLTLFGALDRLGGFFVLASISEFAPWVDSMIVAGVAGTAVTADLGARKISEELDALQVLGVDPVKNLVVPRFLALMLVTGLLDVYALIFGIFGGILAEIVYHQNLAGFWATFFANASVTDLWGSVVKTTIFGAIIAIVCCYKGMTASGGAAGVGRAVNEAVVIAFSGIWAFNYVFTQTLLGNPPRDPGDQVTPLFPPPIPGRPNPPRVPTSTGIGWLAVPKDWIATLGDIIRFCGQSFGDIFNGRVFHFFGEALRQAGILILGSAMVIWGMVFILGLQCGIEGAYFNRSVGAPAYAGVFSAWCDLREMVPYMFGYIMAAKVGTGIVAELGAMRINEEIDALEVMGVRPITFLAATRLLAAWMVLPFIYIAAVGVGFFASYLAVVEQIGEVSSGGYFLIFWMFQNPPDLLFSVIKGMAMATAIVAVGCYYGYTASGGPVGVGQATAKSMILNMVLVHLIGMMGSQIFWGANPRAPIGG